MARPIAFLFLGETLLIPHLWPIAEALAELAPTRPIDIWTATSVHESLLGGWAAPYPAMRLRRAPLFRFVPCPQDGRNPPLPPKLPMLAALCPRLPGAAAVVCAEQTSLWLPRVVPVGLPPFVKTAHGAGSISARDDPRRRAATLTLVPAEVERAASLARGFDPARVVATGYAKNDFRHRTPARALFPEARPTLLYAPHWQRHRSSWWRWGRDLVAQLVAQQRWNVILAPHQRLHEQDPEAARVLDEAARAPHVHADRASFAMVDGSYTAAADLYLGDTSSQVVEFLARPRPCLFLDAQGIDWRATDDHQFWECGDVVDRLDEVLPAIAAASGRHHLYRDRQAAFAEASLGPRDGGAAQRAARAILALTG